jgi:hypothetical protein
MPISQAYLLQIANQQGYTRVRDARNPLIDPQQAMKAGAPITPSGVQVGKAAALAALPTLLTALNTWAVRYRVQEEMNGITPQCDASIASWASNNGTGKCYDPSLVGVIIHLLIEVTSAPIGMPESMSFLDILLGDCGLDAAATIAQYWNQPKATKDVEPQSKMRSMLFWYTIDMPRVTGVGVRAG